MTIETESSGKPREIKRCDKCQDHHAGRPALRLGWPGERKPIGATSRSKCRFSKCPVTHKEISWCNKARLRGAKVWAQLPGAGPRAWGPKPQRTAGKVIGGGPSTW